MSICAVVLAFCVNAAAQSVTVKGRVLFEKSCEPIVSAKVVVMDNLENVEFGQTDSLGNFALKVRPGIYDIKILAVGYNGCIISRVNCMSDCCLIPVKMDKCASMKGPTVYYLSVKMIDTDDPRPTIQKMEIKGVQVNVR